MLIISQLWWWLYMQKLPNGQLEYQLALVGNILFPEEIQPGVYWFFGLMFQIYIFYRIFIYRRPIEWIIIANIIGFATFVFLWLFHDIEVMTVVRHNLSGWILPFTLGVIFARYDFSVLFSKRSWSITFVILSGVVLALMNYNPYLWYLSPIVAIIAAIALAKLRPIGLWAGALSSFIFATHPISRCLLYDREYLSLFGVDINAPYSLGMVALLCTYVLLSLLFALIYQEVHALLFDNKFVTRGRKWIYDRLTLKRR